MRNRAKCRLCQGTVESLTQHDYVACKCGEIAIVGGPYELGTFAKDYKNFLRIDDDGNEKVVEYREKADKKAGDEQPADEPKKVTYKELVEMLDSMIKSFENLPQNALVQPVTHYDLLSLMLVLSAIFKSLPERE